MKIKIIIVGKTREKYIQQGLDDFSKRLQRYIDLEWITIREEKILKNSNESLVKERECQRICEKFYPGDWIIALDSFGQQITSEGLADVFNQKMNQGIKNIVFLIGGPLGLAENIFNKVQQRLSLSKMTFTHELTRLILIEQIYRAFTIIHGEKYHKV
jgi:23S rRNA (pseudouridine1915-N3)-methyltransferase